MIRIQILYMIKAIKEKNYPLVWTYIGQGIATLIPFILASLPLLYFIVGKYKMHFLNRFPFEYVDTIFIWHNFADMLKQNVNIPLVIALVGFVWFYRNVRDWLIRNIFLGWFYISLIMFIYSTIVASVDRHFDIHLPGTVPSFHYFHYLKALQSVFFGMGFVYLTQLVLSWIAKISSKKYNEKRKSNFDAALLISAVLLYATLYFPTYAKRYDFGYPLEHLVVLSDVNQDKIDAYHFIVNNIPSDQVILCEPGDPSIFPVMPS